MKAWRKHNSNPKNKNDKILKKQVPHLFSKIEKIPSALLMALLARVK